MSLKFYKRKVTAVAKCKEKTLKENSSVSSCIVANKNITSYFIIDSYEDLLSTIKKSNIKDYYEFIPANVPINFFLDIEIYKESCPEYFDNPKFVIDYCTSKFKEFTNELNVNLQTIILESHSDTKKSFHVIFRLKKVQDSSKQLLFENVLILKELYKKLKLDTLLDNNNKHLVDPSVYREGLFRTLYSSKHNENRPLVRNEWSDDFTDIESFVCYKNESYEIRTLSTINRRSEQEVDVLTLDDLEPNYQPSVQQSVVNVPEALNASDIATITRFVQNYMYHYPNKIRDVFIDERLNCIIVPLTERYCPFANREHRSNNQYIVIDTYSSKQKCHDLQCKEHKIHELKLEHYPKEINEIIKKCLKVNKQELELIDHAIVECKNYINDNFDHGVKDVLFDRNAMIFRGSVGDQSLSKILKGKCPECNVEHQIGDTGYCLRCTKCMSIFPKQQLIPIDNKYKTLNSFWMNYNQLVNNGTINNIINIYNGTDLEFSCDIKLDNSIFKNKDVTTIVNQILDGHKVTMISKLLNTIDKNFVYSMNNWYHFTGSVWKSDVDNIEMKKEIIDLSKIFDRIKSHYESKQVTESDSLNKNIKSLINKFHKPGFQDDIIKGAKIYYNQEKFLSCLNSKKHLVPFTNGVYDLLENKFRKTKKEDYINLTVSYDYDTNVNNQEVHTFLEQVLPNKGVRDFVLKKMSECLNGDIPNTYFLMFIGDSGANGKSQLLNLMKLAMGDFGEKVEVTLLTRKRNNANEANSEKIKLMNKRFAFLSEPEDGEKINIGLLKELTGSEEIVARGLYQESMSFVMEAKLFLACNELPEIKGEDTALWRRIRVIDFPSRFVDEPKESNEFKIDRTLPSRMREDITWKQTFVNILLTYYNQTVPEPIEVQLKTNEYRQENNDFYNFLSENIELAENEILKLKDVVDVFVGKPVKKEREKSKFKKEIENFIKENFKTVKHEHGKIRYTTDQTSSTTYGWKHLKLKI